ncbi:unnamed protein product [Phytophthora lilii]|uniref:Unnamed protein product n=1 Tax=Phytophthora lilii TaxID=2077276 RepID=A0A9W6TIY9_9STRA|nr:unnamed protein product [Phytophthora lilii]
MHLYTLENDPEPINYQTTDQRISVTSQQLQQNGHRSRTPSSEKSDKYLETGDPFFAPTQADGNDRRLRREIFFLPDSVVGSGAKGFT